MKKNRKIAIQGIQGCFHQQAAITFFDVSIELVECLTFRELCEQLKNGNADFAVMAVENTIAGSILPNYALLQEYRFFICGEVYLPIRMNLVALPGTSLQNITTVSSHHMAIKQCEQYLQQLEKVTLIEMEDTALAAKQIREKKLTNHGAIANNLSADLYNLEVLAEGIETNKANFTRFLILGRTPIHSTYVNKASLFIELSHKPGCLAEVLMVFKNNQLNLTKIQSIPIIGKPYEYSFHIDMEWEEKNHFDKAMQEIGDYVRHLSILGQYEKANWNGSNEN